MYNVTLCSKSQESNKIGKWCTRGKKETLAKKTTATYINTTSRLLEPYMVCASVACFDNFNIGNGIQSFHDRTACKHMKTRLKKAKVISQYW